MFKRAAAQILAVESEQVKCVETGPLARCPDLPEVRMAGFVVSAGFAVQNDLVRSEAPDRRRDGGELLRPVAAVP